MPSLSDPSSSVEPRAPARLRALVLLTALAAASPALLPGAVAYLDNAPHLAEVRLLADEILFEDGWFMGWSDGVLLGTAVGQLNAPLVWTALALLASIGAPLEGLYALGAPLANAVFALGLLRLGERLFGDGRAAAIAALIGALAIPDLYGIGGSLGGMWPFRLANGILLWGLAASPGWTTPRRAIWLAAVLLTHTYSGVIAFGTVALSGVAALLRRAPRAAVGSAASIALAAAATAFFWWELLDESLRPEFSAWRTSPLELAAMLMWPLDVFRLRVFGQLQNLGGGWSLSWVVMWGAGLAGAALRLARGDRRLAQPGQAAEFAIGVGAVVLAAGVVAPLTDWTGLGPNPWRYYAFWRIGLALVGGWGLAALGARGAGGIALVGLVGSLGVGASELPHRIGAERAEVWRNLEATWAAAAWSGLSGPVYHQDPFQTPGGPEGLAWAHLGPMLTSRFGVPTFGSWYGVTPSKTHPWTTSEGAMVFATERWAEPGYLERRLRVYGAGAVLTVEPELERALAENPSMEQIASHPPFALFRPTWAPPARIGAPPSKGTVSGLQVERGAAAATLDGPGAIPFRARIAWHPWWTATLDGEPLELYEGETTGLIEGEAPRAGRLELSWRPPRIGVRYGSLALLIGVALASLRGRRGGDD